MEQEEKLYELARYIVDSLPYNDFEEFGFNDLDSADWVEIPLSNEEYLDILKQHYDIMSLKIVDNEFVIRYNYSCKEFKYLIRDSNILEHKHNNNELYIDELFYYYNKVYVRSLKDE